MIEITSNAKETSASFNKLADTLVEAVVKDAIQPTLKAIAYGAKREHRHIRRTGNLERSIKTENKKNGGMVYVDDTSCDYGKFVHMGQRSWKPDQFVFESYDRTEAVLDQKIDKAIDDALRKAGI